MLHALGHYQYDRFGNRWQQNGGVGMLVTFNNNSNRVDGYCYDAAGNLLREAACPADLGTVPYKYDAENRLISANGATYVYDAFGRRVQKTASGSAEDYIYDLGNRVITRMNGSSWAGGEVFAGGKHLATYASGTAYFNHSDWLGSERARTDATGTISATCKSLPFGDGQQCTGNDTSPNHFTGKERDDFGPTTPPLDYFGARYYSSTMGRFLTSDWAAVPAPIPYADMANPQTLNLYSYVENNPITGTDPDGHLMAVRAPSIGSRDSLGEVAAEMMGTVWAGLRGMTLVRESQVVFASQVGAQNQVTPQSLRDQIPGDVRANLRG